jgi:purine-binding chemotaxis protein CheW
VSAEGLVQLCVLRIGSEEYVLDIRRVEEIIPAPTVTPVPRAPSFLEGVLKLRGEVVPVVDVRKRLRVAPSGAKDKLVVCRVGRRRVGLVVDAVTSVLKVERSELKPAPLAAHPGRMPHVLGVCGEPGRLRLLLDVKALLTEDSP